MRFEVRVTSFDVSLVRRDHGFDVHALISRWRQGLNRSDQSQMEMASFFEWASMPITNRDSSSVHLKPSA